MTFETLRARLPWRPIANCPGRYVLAGGTSRLAPEDIAVPDDGPREFIVRTARDPILVFRVGNAGVISYRKPDGTYVHTLNTIDAFERKLASLGIRWERGPEV